MAVQPAQDDWVRTAAQAEQIPVYSLKTAGRAALARGIRIVLGTDSSPGAVFHGGALPAPSSGANAGRPGARSPTLAGFVKQVLADAYHMALLPSCASNCNSQLVVRAVRCPAVSNVAKK